MRTFILITLLLSPIFSQAVVCVGIYEYLNEQGHGVVESKTLEVVYEDPKTLKLTTDLGSIHYLALADKVSDSYLLMVTLGPDYTSGVTAGLTWDKSNSMRISRVDQDSVYRLVCKK